MPLEQSKSRRRNQVKQKGDMGTTSTFFGAVLCLVAGLLYFCGRSWYVDKRTERPISKSVDDEIDERGREISLSYLLGTHEENDLLHSLCKEVLAPELMKLAFKDKHGFDWDHASAAPYREEWAKSWRDYRLSLDKSGVLGLAMYKRATE